MMLFHLIPAIPLLITAALVSVGKYGDGLNNLSKQFADVQPITEDYRCGIMDKTSEYAVPFFVVIFFELFFYIIGVIYLSYLIVKRWKAMKSMQANDTKNGQSMKLERQLITAVVVQVKHF